MTSALEKERKFLIKLPLNKEAQELVIDKADAPAHIVQTYLSVSEGFSERVRMISVEMWGKTMPAHYAHTTKKYISPGVNEETEEAITRDEYMNLLRRADPSKTDIVKTRYFVTWESKIFELDIFHEEYEGTAILEIELSDMNESVSLPPFLEVIREVTNEIEYSNATMASKKD